MTEWKSYIYMCEKSCEYLFSVFSKKNNVKKSASVRYESYTCMCGRFFIRFRGMEVQEELHI